MESAESVILWEWRTVDFACGELSMWNVKICLIGGRQIGVPPEGQSTGQTTRKYVRGHVIRMRLKLAKKYCLYPDIFRCVKINVFRQLFAFRLEMHVRCDNQYETGADGGTILGQPMLI